jgi:zinc protease
VAGPLAGLNGFGLPLPTTPADTAAINKLTAADVQRAARKYIDPEHLTVVIVGDIATIRPGIEALDLGPVEVRDYNGNEVMK